MRCDPNPGKINMGSPFSVRPAVAKLEDLKQRNHQLEPLRGQRKALEKTRRGSSARSNSIGDGPANSLNKSSTQLWLTLDP
jgi:hypothetical protein